MPNRLTRLHIKNFRSLADVSIETSAINVLFGPNGAGKSSLLYAIWFVRDCVVRDVSLASSVQNHGVGLLWQGADRGANISIKLETCYAEYELLFGFSAGRIEPFVGEILDPKSDSKRLINREIGSKIAWLYRTGDGLLDRVDLREPEKLALVKYPDIVGDNPLAVSEIDRLLRFARFSQSRDADLPHLKQYGSGSDFHMDLRDRCRNLWSVLRNLRDKQAIDQRYEIIIGFMRKGFPPFKDLVFEQTGPNSIYASFLEEGRRDPILASGVSDGQLQMLILLTILFSEVKENQSLILFDEPETSLHPFALSIFAESVKLATEEWNKQVFIATHSPVLISQFEPKDILAAELDESGQTVLTRVSEMEGIKDLLEDYAVGSLYMAEAIAPQSRLRTKEAGN